LRSASTSARNAATSSRSAVISSASVARSVPGAAAAEALLQRSFGRALGQELRPARLARSRRARQLGDERTGLPLGELVQERVDGRDVGEAVHPLGVDAKLAGRLRATQQQYGDQRHRLRRQREDALRVVRIAHHAAAARLDHERLVRKRVERLLHVAVGQGHDRVAARLLVAAGDERVQRQRIGVGYRALPFDQHTEHPALGGRKEERAHGPMVLLVYSAKEARIDRAAMKATWPIPPK